jgi:ATP synthase protein I
MIDTITRGEWQEAQEEHRNLEQEDSEQEDSEQEVIRPWSQEEAETWRSQNPSLSPWRVVAVQAVAGLACGAITWAVTQRSETALSALYGAAVVVVPGALLARGMTRDLSRVKGAVGVAVFSFMLWEMVKIGVAVAMLALAPKVVADLSWPALLVAMIVCVKMNWLALLWRRRRVVTDTTQRV